MALKIGSFITNFISNAYEIFKFYILLFLIYEASSIVMELLFNALRHFFIEFFMEIDIES